MDIYRERAHLVALLTSLYPSYGAFNDPEYPDWLVVHIETPEGLMAWHVHPEDRDLFEGLEVRNVPRMDFSTPEEKYQRMKKLQDSCAQTSLVAQTMTAEAPKGRAKLDSLLLSYARVQKPVTASVRAW